MTSDVAGASRPTRRLIITALIVWLVTALLLPLTALTLNAVQVAGFPLGFYFTAQAALVILSGLAIVFMLRAEGEHGREGFIAPLVFAGEVIGSAGFIGYAGLIAALGYDALSYPLGVAAGLALMAILIAPRFVLYPVATVGGFFTARFGGVWPRRIALAILGLASVLLLAADIRGAGLAAGALTGVDQGLGFIAVAGLIFLAWLISVVWSGRPRVGAVFAVLIGVFSALLIGFTLLQSRLPLPYWSYGLALQDVASIEIGLIGRKLADVRALKPLSSPFLQFSMWNFAGIVLAIALGLAVLPQLIGRHLSSVAVAPGAAVRRVTITLALVSVFLCGLAPFAVFARVSLAKLIEPGVKTAELPSAITDTAARGWIEVCGVNGSAAVSLDAACAKVSGHKGLLRLQDLAFEPDSYVFAAARIASVPEWLWLLLAGAALLAGLVAGHALLAGFVSATAESAAATGAPVRQKAAPGSAALGVLLLLAALAAAAYSDASIAALASEGLALIASSLFPAVVLSLYWRRFNGAGAIAAMLAGFFAAAVYIAGVRLFPGTFFELTGAWSNAPASAVRKLVSLEAAVQTATDPAARAAAAAALHQAASGVANWWGLKPAASVLFALPCALLTGVAVALAAGRPRPLDTSDRT